jgi:hypothetical protein
MYDITDPVSQDVKDTFHRWVDDGLPFDALPLAVQDRYRFLPPDADWSDITIGFSDNALDKLEAHKKPGAELEYRQQITREYQSWVARGFAPPPNRIN